MFVLNRSHSFIEADESDILELYRSSAPLRLDLPGYGAEQCRGYLCVDREEENTRVHAALYLLDTRRGLIYAADRNPAESIDQARLIQEGSDFLTAFGYTLEKVNLSFSKALREVVLRDTRIVRPPDPVKKASRKMAAQQQAMKNSQETGISLPGRTGGDSGEIPGESDENRTNERERLAAEKSKAARTLAERAARILAGRAALAAQPHSAAARQTFSSGPGTAEQQPRGGPLYELKRQSEEMAQLAETERHSREQAIIAQQLLLAEQELVAVEKLRYERLLAEKSEAERLAREKAEAEQVERERLAAEKTDMERLLAETAEAERLARARAAAESAELQRLAAERIAAITAEAEQQNRERTRAEKEERQRLAVEKSEMERLLAERVEAERQAHQKAALEQAEKERLSAEKGEMERLLAERAEADQRALLRAAGEQLQRERLLDERLAAEKADSERLAREQAEREQARWDRLALEKAEIERLLQEKVLAEQEAQHHAATAQAELVRLIAEHAEMGLLLEEKILSERCGWEQVAIEQEERKKLSAEMREAQRLLAEKSLAERLAREEAHREQSAKEELLAEIERQSREWTIAEQQYRERLAAERAELELLLAETRQAERSARGRIAEIEAEKLRLEEEIAARRPPEVDDIRRWREDEGFPASTGTALPSFTPPERCSPLAGFDADPFGTGGGDIGFGGAGFGGFGVSREATIIFSFDRSREAIEYRLPEDIMEIYRCANVSRMAPEGYPMQGCIGYVCSLFRNDRMTVEIALFLTESKRPLIYCPDSQPETPADYARMVQDAIGFLEMVGYIIDPLPLSEEPVARQRELGKIQVLKAGF